MSVCNKHIWMIANSGSDLMLYKMADYTAAKASSDLILEVCDRDTQPLRKG
jgi:hypothetical protein